MKPTRCFPRRYGWMGVIVIAVVILLVTAFTFLERHKRMEGFILQTRAEVRVLTANLELYREETGTYPPIENRAVVNALCGDNPKHKKFGSRSDLRLNADGQVIDPFGRPYIFSYVGEKAKVRSLTVNVSSD
jgi:hypothetical protein